MPQFKNDISRNEVSESHDEGFVSEEKINEADHTYEKFLSDYFSNDVSYKGQPDTPKGIKSKDSDFESVLSALQKDIINDPSSRSSIDVNEKRRLSADEALDKALNVPESLANQTDSEEDSDEVRDLCDDIKRGINNDDDVIVHDGLYPEYEKMIESGEYEDEEDLCNGEGLNYDDIYDVKSERYGDEYEQGFKDGWNSVDDESHDNEAYNQGVNDAERLTSLCGQYNYYKDFPDSEKGLAPSEVEKNEESNEVTNDANDFPHNNEVKTRTPENHGEWDGERGNSTWHPDPDYVPPEKSRSPEDRPYSNPDNLSWGELLEKYGLDGIEFKDGFPVFSDISKGTVEIDGFETGGSDAKDRNFKRADIATAEQRNCSPSEVKKWREDNNYTWHECEDKRTMQKVPNEVHANVPHDGGRSQ